MSMKITPGITPVVEGTVMFTLYNIDTNMVFTINEQTLLFPSKEAGEEFLAFCAFNVVNLYVDIVHTKLPSNDNKV